MRFRRVIQALIVVCCVLPAAQAWAQYHPYIRRVYPREGPIGTRVTIEGRFVPGVTVYFTGGRPLHVVARSRTRLVVVIPADAESGTLLVTYGDEEESAGEFRVVPPPSVHDAQAGRVRRARGTGTRACARPSPA
jgi:hypothetical protein